MALMGVTICQRGTFIRCKKNLNIDVGIFLCHVKTEFQIRCVKLTSVDTTCTCVIPSSNPLSDHLLESSRRDDSNKWSDIGFGEDKGIVAIKICILSGALTTQCATTVKPVVSVHRPDLSYNINPSECQTVGNTR